MSLSRRRFLTSAASATTAAAVAGCIATDPSVDADLSGDAFASVEPTQSISWGANAVSVSITLTDGATTDLKVRRLVAVRDGSVAWTGGVEAGETSASAFLPVNATCTMLAVDSDANVVDSVLVRVGASTFP